MEKKKQRKKILGLEQGSNPHAHIFCVMLYQLSSRFQAPGSKMVGRMGIQDLVLVLGAHNIKQSFSYGTPLLVMMLPPVVLG